MAKFFLIGLAIKVWPLVKDEVVELAKSVLRDIAREEAKKGLKNIFKAGTEGLKGLLEVTPAPPAPPAEVVDPFQRELLVEAAVCVDDVPALPRLLPRQGLLSLFGDDRALKVLAPSLEAILGRLGGEIEPTVEAILRSKLVSPGLQSALRCRLELPAVEEVLSRKMATGGVQSIDYSTLRAFASRARAAGPCSITSATAGAGAEALHLALPGVMDFIVYTAAAGVIALVLYLIWRGPGGDE